MFIGGHVGLGLGALLAVRRRLPAREPLSLAWVALFALLPDILDKPVGLLFLELGSRRLLAHSLLFSLATLGVVGLLRPRLLPYAWLTPLHLLLDRMWAWPHTLLFPFLGARFDPDPLPPAGLVDYAQLLLWKLTHQPDMVLGEIAGWALLGVYVWNRRRRCAGLPASPPAGLR